MISLCNNIVWYIAVLMALAPIIIEKDPCGCDLLLRLHLQRPGA